MNAMMSAPSIFSRFNPRSILLSARTSHVFRPRSIHVVPALTHIDLFAENGIPGAFSKKAFKTSWTVYQQNLVDNLNRLIQGTTYADKLPQDIAVMTSRHSDLAATFNYASQAHNNHFFFEALSPHQTSLSIPDTFSQYIPDSFSSVDALKIELLTTATSMFGAGWVWLVLDSNKFLRILCTYNAGTPYGETYRLQNKDMNSRQTLGSSIHDLSEVTRLPNRKPLSNWVMPLLNINVWEHAWLEDFGVDGKQDYLEAVWKAIDWHVVNSRCPLPGTSIREPFNK